MRTNIYATILNSAIPTRDMWCESAHLCNSHFVNLFFGFQDPGTSFLVNKKTPCWTSNVHKVLQISGDSIFADKKTTVGRSLLTRVCKITRIEKHSFPIQVQVFSRIPPANSYKLRHQIDYSGPKPQKIPGPKLNKSSPKSQLKNLN
jgi:hypothetical protein